MKRKRIELIDAARGIAILAMVFHHALYSLEAFYNINVPLLRWGIFYVFQFFFVAVFMLVAGISSNFSRSNVRRGIITLLAGFLVTAVSWYIDPASPVYFGILHFMGTSMTLYGVFEKWFQRIPVKIGLIATTLLFAANYWIYNAVPRIDIPHLYMFGFPDHAFSSADYYPLFPYFFLFLAGTVLGRLIVAGKFPKWFYEKKVAFFPWVGRHTLWIYLLHQPVILGIYTLLLGSPF